MFEVPDRIYLQNELKAHLNAKNQGKDVGSHDCATCGKLFQYESGLRTSYQGEPYDTIPTQSATCGTQYVCKSAVSPGNFAGLSPCLS